jgi:hypothetical protein
MRGEWINGNMGERMNKKKENNIIFMRGEWINGSMGERKNKKKKKIILFS